MFVAVIVLKNTLCWLVIDHADIFLNKPIQFYLNDTANLFAICLNALYGVIPTKWRSYRDQGLCDVSSPYVYVS